MVVFDQRNLQSADTPTSSQTQVRQGERSNADVQSPSLSTEAVIPSRNGNQFTEFGGRELQRQRQYAQTLAGFLDQKPPNTEQIFSLLADKTKEEIDGISRAFQHQHSSGASLQQYLERSLSGEDLKTAQLLSQGREIRSSRESIANWSIAYDASTKLDAALSSEQVRPEAVYASLRTLSAEQVSYARQMYEQRFGRSLQSDIDGKLEGENLERANDLLQGYERSGERELQRRLSDLQVSITEYSEKRGELLGSVRPDRSAVRALDAQHAKDMEQFADLLENETLKAKVDQIQQSTEDQSRANVVATELAKMEDYRGFARAQGKSYSTRFRNNYMDRQKDLLERNPQLQEKLDDVGRRGYRAGQQRWQQAVGASENLYNAMWGPGTDEAKIFRTLEGKSPQEIAAIETAYQRYYGVSLKRRLRQDLGGTDLERANQLMKGDRVASASAKLYHAMSGAGTNEAEINEVFLQAKDQEEIRAIEEHFNSHYARRYGADDLQDALHTELGGDDLKLALAYKSKDDIHVAAVELHDAVHGPGTDEARIYRVLQGIDPSQMDTLRSDYLITYKRSLDSDLKADLGGLHETRAMRLLAGDRAGADAAGLERAMNGGFMFGLGTDENMIREILEGSSQEHRDAIEAAYDRSYGERRGVPLAQEFKDEMQGHHLQMTESLMANGELSPAELVRDAVRGLGTDEDQLHSALEGKTKQQLASMRNEYREKFGVEMDADLLADLSGDDYFDARQNLLGTPESIEESLSRLEQRHAYERSGVWSGLIDVFSSQGRATDTKMAETREIMGNAIALERRGRLTQEVKIDAEVREDIQRSAEDAVREAKNAVSNTLATTGTIVVATGTTIGTLGAGAPLWAAALATAGAAAYTRTLIQSGVKGRGYGWEEGVFDLGLSSVEGASVFVGGVAGKEAAKAVLRGLAMKALKEAGEEITEEGLKLATSQLMTRFSTRLGVGTVEALTDGAVSGGFEGAIGPQSLESLAEADLEIAFKRWITNMVTGSGMGGAAGTTLGTAFTSAGEGLSRNLRRTGVNLDSSVPPSTVGSPDVTVPNTSSLDGTPGATGSSVDGNLDADVDIMDTILNSPSINHELPPTHPDYIPRDGNTADLNPSGYQDPPQFSEQFGNEAELVGVGAESSPPELSAAIDGPAYQANGNNRSNDDILESPSMSGADRNQGNNNSGSGGGDSDNLQSSTVNRGNSQQGNGPGRQAGLDKELLDELQSRIETNDTSFSQDDILLFSAEATPQQIAALPAAVRNRIESVQIAHGLKGTLDPSVDIANLADTLTQLGRSDAGVELRDIEAMLRANPVSGPKHLDQLSALQKRGAVELDAVLEPTTLNDTIVTRMNNEGAGLQKASSPGGMADIVHIYEVHTALLPAKASSGLSEADWKVFVQNTTEMLRSPDIAARISPEAIATIVQSRGRQGAIAVFQSASLSSSGFSKYVADSLEQLESAAKVKNRGEMSYIEGDIARTHSLDQFYQGKIPSRGIADTPLRPGERPDGGLVVEQDWVNVARTAGREAITAGDAIEYFAKKHGLEVPQGSQNVGLEMNVDFAVSRDPNMDFWEGDYMLVQVKSSVEGGSGHLRIMAGKPEVVPVVVGRPQNISTPRDLAAQLDLLDTDFIYPRSWPGEGAKFDEFKELSEQAIQSGRPRSQQKPPWFSAFVEHNQEAERRLVERMRRNLEEPPRPNSR